MTLRSEVAKHLFKEDIADKFKRRITGGFWNTDASYPYKPHIGVDYGADIGEELIAYDDYEVIGVNTGSSDYGQHVFLYFPKIDKTGHYAHMDSITVSKGQKGKARDVIGTSGNTGKSSGAHLHFGFANGKVTNTNKGSEGNPWINFETYVYSSGLVKQDGKFTVTVAEGLNVRKEPSVKAERVTGLSKGQSVIYDNYIDSEGYRWVSWLHNGVRVYGARRTLDNKEIYGTATDVGEVNKPSVPLPNKVGQILVVRDSFPRAKFTAYEDKACKIPLAPWTIANYNHNLSFKIVEDLDPVFKCVQYGKTPMYGVSHVYIPYEPGIGFDKV